MKKVLTSKAKEILQFIYRSGGVVSANRISTSTNIAYVTVMKHLKNLEEHELILPVYHKVRKLPTEEKKIKRLKKKVEEKKKRGQTRRYIINPLILNEIKVSH